MKKYVIQYNSDYTGCGFWRFLWPQYLLNIMGIAEVHHSHLFIRDYLHYLRADVVHLQRQCKPSQSDFFERLASMRESLGIRIVYDVDDVIFREDVPDYNRGKKEIIHNDVREAQQKIIEFCDEMTVATPFLRDYYLQKSAQKKISVIPNYAPSFYMGHLYNIDKVLENYQNRRGRHRIVYSGSPSHVDIDMVTKDHMVDDFQHVKDFMINTRKEFLWTFVGTYPLSITPYLKSGEMEFYSWKSIYNYMNFLESLGPNLFVAPLVDSTFNRGKSDIKLLEASALGVPVLCQDMCTYAAAPFRFKSGGEMIDKIREILKSKDSFLESIKVSRKVLENRWLENKENIGKYYDLYSFPYGDLRRSYI